MNIETPRAAGIALKDKASISQQHAGIHNGRASGHQRQTSSPE
jgi:hypothetical protein